MDEEIELTTGEVLDRMKEVWLNEQAAPDLLIPRMEYVDCLLEQITLAEDNIQTMRTTKKNDITIPIHRLEIERIRYLINGYLRCRIGKIEKFCYHLLDDDTKRLGLSENPRLTTEEREYVTKYADSIDKYIQTNALDHMPHGFKNITKDKLATLPDINYYIFVRVNKACSDVFVQDPVDASKENEVRLEPGEQHILPYSSISHHLEKNHVALM